MSIETFDYDFFGIAATYTPLGGVGDSVTIVLDEQYDQTKNTSPDTIRNDAEISVRQSEVAARPGYRDKFTTTDGAGTSQDWYIVPDGVRENRVFDAFAGEWVCKVMHDERTVPRR